MLKKSKKIAKIEIVSRFRKQLRVLREEMAQLHSEIKDQMGEGTCPVTFEEYDLENPPFLTDTCRHSVSLTALNNFQIYIVVSENKRFKLMRCPICREYFNFAALNVSFLKLWYLSQKRGSSKMRLEEFDQQLKRLPRYFTPKNGYLSFRWRKGTKSPV